MYGELVTHQEGDPTQHQLDTDSWMQVTDVDHRRVYGIGTMAHARALLQPHGAGSSAFTSSSAGPSTSCADQDRLATIETAQARHSTDMVTMRDTIKHVTEYLADVQNLSSLRSLLQSFIGALATLFRNKRGTACAESHHVQLPQLEPGLRSPPLAPAKAGLHSPSAVEVRASGITVLGGLVPSGFIQHS
ncbi:hypothetical protein Cni_G16611 [Canna indica]|uniref:Uncharacterized protein n=1 Tax=Canna indica TaxID=4628 RepID=A0AAQ3KL72_9LILI|nr:hypothetical protein Cni_G16611 [Canna indica]